MLASLWQAGRAPRASSSALLCGAVRLCRQFFWIFIAVAIGLGYLGSKPAEGGYVIAARILTLYYFVHFLIILPVLGRTEYGLSLLDAEMDFKVSLASQQIIERHTSALATELVALFHHTVLREYRERGRPPELRTRLLALVQRLKPITVDGVVTNFQLAVNRAIRESAMPSTTTKSASPL